MKKNFLGWMSVLGLLGAVACGGGGGEGDHHDHESHSGGEDLSAFEGPVNGDASAGATVYATFCDGCHPGGAEGVGPDLHGRTDEAAEIRALIRHGEDRMPGFDADQISDEDLENVMAYLQDSFGMFQ